MYQYIWYTCVTLIGLYPSTTFQEAVTVISDREATTYIYHVHVYTGNHFLVLTELCQFDLPKVTKKKKKNWRILCIVPIIMIIMYNNVV